jgi:hypothetical protein
MVKPPFGSAALQASNMPISQGTSKKHYKSAIYAYLIDHNVSICNG